METVTFLFTDIAGSTALLRQVGECAYADVPADHHSVIRSALAAPDGEGNRHLAPFSSPRACLAAVLDIQCAMQAHAWPDGERVLVRMGVHTGEAAQSVTGLVDLNVHRAARVAGVAHGGQVLVSETMALRARRGTTKSFHAESRMQLVPAGLSQQRTRSAVDLLGRGPAACRSRSSSSQS